MADSEAMTVVVATDGSGRAQEALTLVRTINWPAGSVIHVVKVVERTGPPSGVVPGAENIEPAAEMIGGAADELGKLGRTIAEGGVKVETDILFGRPASEIVSKADAVRADVIVVGSRGRGTISQMLLGSVSSEVADQAHCPVLVARRGRLAKMVLGVDGSGFARTAEEVVARWPIFEDVDIEVTSVGATELPWTSGLALSASRGVDYAATFGAVVEEHQREADAATGRLVSAGRQATSRVVQGRPADELIRVAAEGDADLIVLGTHGRAGLSRLLLGSVARNVMVHASCSVLVVREVRAPAAN